METKLFTKEYFIIRIYRSILMKYTGKNVTAVILDTGERVIIMSS